MKMVTYVKMPRLTWTMEEGIVGEWHKQVGDQIEKGDILCEIETEKSIDELKAPEHGILGKIVSPRGSIVKVNGVIAVVTTPGEAVPEGIPSEITESPVESKPSEEAVKMTEVAVSTVVDALKVSPVARKLAEEHGIDLRKIRGTGPEGRIVKEDVLKALEKAPQTRIVSLSRMREVTKNRLSLSMKNALPVPLTIEADMTEAIKLIGNSRAKMEQEHSVHATTTSVLVKAVARALEVHPILNARFVNEQIEMPEEVNVGVAVALEEGLVVPVIHTTNKKALAEIAKEILDLAEKARTGTLSTAESSGGTFTVSNLGMFGIDFFAPIINPPESAILGVGRVVKKPIVINDELALRLMMTLTLVFDHRTMDGAVAAKFLQTLKGRLEKPADLFT
jgi:pyruvate dehydrogenase E2 component (dihydrolipoamide acetyltransferase)